MPTGLLIHPLIRPLLRGAIHDQEGCLWRAATLADIPLTGFFEYSHDQDAGTNYTFVNGNEVLTFDLLTDPGLVLTAVVPGVLEFDPVTGRRAMRTDTAGNGSNTIKFEYNNVTTPVFPAGSTGYISIFTMYRADDPQSLYTALNLTDQPVDRRFQVRDNSGDRFRLRTSDETVGNISTTPDVDPMGSAVGGIAGGRFNRADKSGHIAWGFRETAVGTATGPYTEDMSEVRYLDLQKITNNGAIGYTYDFGGFGWDEDAAPYIGEILGIAAWFIGQNALDQLALNPDPDISKYADDPVFYCPQTGEFKPRSEVVAAGMFSLDFDQEFD
jgi:hypothetical protein